MQESRIDLTFDLAPRDFVSARVALSLAERYTSLRTNYLSFFVVFVLAFAMCLVLGLGRYAFMLAPAAPVLAFWLFPWWRRHRLCRTLQARTTFPEVAAHLGPNSISLGPAGVSVSTPAGHSLIAWPEVIGVISIPEYLVLETPAEPIVLPLRAIPYAADVVNLVRRFQPNARLSNA